MTYSPIIIPTLCRYDGLVGCIESLKKDTFSAKTDIYVVVDYPSKDSHWSGYNKIKAYLQNDFPEFNSFNVIYRKKNYGAIGNLENAVKLILEKYDRCICTFDDLTHSANFIQYMDTMLDKFENDHSVVAVTGYSYPVSWKVSESSTAVKQNFVASIWGIGLWRGDSLEMLEYISKNGLIKSFPRAYNEGIFNHMTDWAITDYVSNVTCGVVGKTFINRFTDIALRIYLAVCDKYVVMPVVSKVRNTGFDGSGEFCEKISYESEEQATSQNFDYATQLLDDKKTFLPAMDESFDIDANRAILNNFDKVDARKLSDALKKAEIYCNHSFLWKKCLDVESLFRRVYRRLK